MKTCPDCGCRKIGKRCTNCHEELFIRDQYIEDGLRMPDKNTDFMKKVAQQTIQIKKREDDSKG